MINMYCDIEQEIRGAVITDMEYHPDTGELLTIWMRLTDGQFVSVIPDDYRMVVIHCSWAEKLHGNFKK